jgi:hypothetical protein
MKNYVFNNSHGEILNYKQQILLKLNIDKSQCTIQNKLNISF